MSYSQGSPGSKPYPSWLQAYFRGNTLTDKQRARMEKKGQTPALDPQISPLDTVTNLLDSYNNNTDGSRELRAKGQGLVSDTVDGKFLESPYLAEQYKEIERRGQETLDRNLAGTDRNAQQGGVLLGSARNKINAEAARKSTADVAGAQLATVAGQYDKERSRQDNAVNTAAKYSQMPLNELLQFFGLFKGPTSGGTAPNYAYTGGTSFGPSGG